MTDLCARVVSYNVLSERLCRREEYFACASTHLQTERRHAAIEKMLAQEVAVLSIICLQELTVAFANRLVVFFEEHDYMLVHDHYGHRQTGWMGTAIAFLQGVQARGATLKSQPGAKWIHESAALLREGHKARDGGADPRRHPPPSCSSQILNRRRGPLISGLPLPFGAGSRPRGRCGRSRCRFAASVAIAARDDPGGRLTDRCRCPLATSGTQQTKAHHRGVAPAHREARAGRSTAVLARELRGEQPPSADLGTGLLQQPTNRLVALRLVDLRAWPFWVATYHMPCKFFPPAMVTFAALATQRLQKMAGELPYVLAGDNFTLESTMYRLLTTGLPARAPTTDCAQDVARTTGQVEPARLADAQCYVGRRARARPHQPPPLGSSAPADAHSRRRSITSSCRPTGTGRPCSAPSRKSIAA